MGRHAFGSLPASRRSWGPILRQYTGLWPSVDTSYQKHCCFVSIFGYVERILFILLLVFKLHWILLILAFWPRPQTGFETSARNKGASHVSTARKLIPDAPRAIRMAAVSWRLLSQIGF